MIEFKKEYLLKLEFPLKIWVFSAIHIFFSIFCWYSRYRKVRGLGEAVKLRPSGRRYTDFPQ
ncbi:MAG: hypothetical protein ACP5RZ_03475, partial [Thermoplasmata archaeon]